MGNTTDTIQMGLQQPPKANELEAFSAVTNQTNKQQSQAERENKIDLPKSAGKVEPHPKEKTDLPYSSGPISNTEPPLLSMESKIAKYAKTMPQFFPALSKVLRKPVQKWTVNDVETWLKQIGMSTLNQNFKQLSIDGSSIFLLNEQDLRGELKIRSRMGLATILAWVQEGFEMYCKFLEREGVPPYTGTSIQQMKLTFENKDNDVPAPSERKTQNSELPPLIVTEPIAEGPARSINKSSSELVPANKFIPNCQQASSHEVRNYKQPTRHIEILDAASNLTIAVTEFPYLLVKQIDQALRDERNYCPGNNRTYVPLRSQMFYCDPRCPYYAQLDIELTQQTYTNKDNIVEHNFYLQAKKMEKIETPKKVKSSYINYAEGAQLTEYEYLSQKSCQSDSWDNQAYEDYSESQPLYPEVQVSIALKQPLALHEGIKFSIYDINFSVALVAPRPKRALALVLNAEQYGQYYELEISPSAHQTVLAAYMKMNHHRQEPVLQGMPEGVDEVEWENGFRHYELMVGIAYVSDQAKYYLCKAGQLVSFVRMCRARIQKKADQQKERKQRQEIQKLKGDRQPLPPPATINQPPQQQPQPPRPQLQVPKLNRAPNTAPPPPVWIQHPQSVLFSQRMHLRNNTMLKIGSRELTFTIVRTTVITSSLSQHVDGMIKSMPQYQEYAARNRCVICYQNRNNCLFMDCKHNVSCVACGKLCDSCPVCRKGITEHIRVYTR